MRSTRSLFACAIWDGQPLAPYLILLQVGFALHPRLREDRWSLTPPFHPYPGSALRRHRDGLFLWHYPSRRFARRASSTRLSAWLKHFALWSPDFPLLRERKSDRNPIQSNVKGTLRTQGFQYKTRPQKLQHTMLAFRFTSWTTWGGSFIWHPPQEPPFSTGTRAKSPVCLNVRS